MYLYVNVLKTLIRTFFACISSISGQWKPKPTYSNIVNSTRQLIVTLVFIHISKVTYLEHDSNQIYRFVVWPMLFSLIFADV